MMAVNLTHLRTFHAVAQEGGFSRAADILGVAQPTLSQQVQALEARYGVQLFERHRRGIRLTATGEDLLEIAARVFSSADEADELLDGTRGLEMGRLRLGATASKIIVPIMAAFSARYPGPQLSLVVENSAQLERDLQNGLLDAAVLAQAPDDTWLDAVTLRSDSIFMVAAHDHRWSDLPAIGLEELVSDTLVLREAGTTTRDIFDDTLRDAGVKAERIMEIDDWESMRDIVAAGLGVTVMTLTDANVRHDPRLKAVPIEGTAMHLVENLVVMPERRRLRVVRAFIELATEMSDEI